MADGSEVSRSVAKTVCYATNGLKDEGRRGKKMLKCEKLKHRRLRMADSKCKTRIADGEKAER